MATKKQSSISARDALAAVRQAAADLTEALNGARQHRQALEAELNELLNKPLSKAALIQLLERRTDAAATYYASNFANAVAPKMLSVDRGAGLGSTRLVLADVPALTGVPLIRPSASGAPAAGVMHGSARWWIGDPLAISYFLRDELKAKLPELMEGVTLPYPDDGKNLEEREAEVAAVLGKIDESEQRIAGIQAELADLGDVLPPEPEVVPPPPEPKGDWEYIPGSGIQPTNPAWREPGKMPAYRAGVAVFNDE